MTGRITLLLGLLLLATACGGGSSSTSSSSGSIAGNWQMTLQKSNTKLKRTQSGFLLQNKDTVTGGVIFTDFPCSRVGSVTGSLTGTDIGFSVSLTGLTVNLTGTLGSDQASMSGDYTILATGCEGVLTNTQETGSWTASLVKPLSGNFQGTFKSTRLGTSYPVTGQVSQGPNTGISNAPLTGNLSVTGYCFTGAKISGVVSGTAVVMNLLNSDGTQVGELTGTSALDGSSVTGTYQVLPQGPTGTPPCDDGERGTVTLTL